MFRNNNDQNNVPDYVTSYLDRLKTFRSRMNDKLVSAMAPNAVGGVAGGVTGAAAGQMLGYQAAKLAEKKLGSGTLTSYSKGLLGKSAHRLKRPYLVGARALGGIAGNLIGQRLALPFTQNRIVKAVTNISDRDKKLLMPTSKEMQKAMLDPNVGSYIQAARNLLPSVRVRLPSREDVQDATRTIGYQAANDYMSRRR